MFSSSSGTLIQLIANSGAAQPTRWHVCSASTVVLISSWFKTTQGSPWNFLVSIETVENVYYLLLHEKKNVTWYQGKSGQVQPANHNLSRHFLFLKLFTINLSQYQWELRYFMRIPELWHNGSWGMQQKMLSSWPPWALNCTKFCYDLNCWAGWDLMQQALIWSSFFAECFQNEHQEEQN
jgi:hypothetical protein